MIDKFDKVVGFTSLDCTCIDDSRPVDYATSHSGYFLDEGEHGINLLIPTAQCGDGSLWAMLQRTKEAALNDFLMHFGNKLRENQNKVLNNKAVTIGKNDYTQLAAGDAFRGARVRPLVYKGATLVLTSLKFYSKTTETITITVAPTVGAAQTFVISAVTGFNQALTTPIRLPLSSSGERIDYNIYHDSAETTVNNVIYCASCVNKKVNYNGILDVQGVSGSTEDILKESEIYKNRASGFIIEGRIDCEGLDWLANVEDDYYKLNSYGRTVAKTIQMMWTVKTVSEILASNSINFYTTLSREHLYGKRNHLNKLLQDMIIILAADLPEDLSHCYICNPAFGFSKQSL